MSRRYPDDVRRIQMVALAHGVTLSAEDAEAAWNSYSDSMAAGWMGLPEDDAHLWSTVSYHLEKTETFPRQDDEPGYTPRHFDDVQRIQRVALSHGVTLSMREAETAWDDFSDSMAAGWMGLPENDEHLWSDVRNRIPT